MPKPKGDLTDKQRLFVAEYVRTKNATQAALFAGYSKKTAKVVGAQNLSKLNIQKEIAKKLKAIESETIIGAKEIRERLTKIARREEFEEVQIVSRKGNSKNKDVKLIKERTKVRDALDALKVLLQDEELKQKDDDEVRIIDDLEGEDDGSYQTE